MKKKGIFPLTFKFRSTTHGRAFLINAFVQSLIAVCAVQIRVYLDNRNKVSIPSSKLNNSRQKKAVAPRYSQTLIAIVTFISTFISAIIIYFSLWALIAYGGGLLADKIPRASLF